MSHVSIEWRVLEDPGSFPSGHGIGLFDSERPASDGLIAFVDGFDWYHGFSDTAVVYCIPPDDLTPANVIACMKQLVEERLQKRSLPDGALTGRIHALPNA
jgi:hypothetical protein